MTISIPDKNLLAAKIDPSDLLVDFATILYDRNVFSITEATQLAKIDMKSFQKVLSKRNIRKSNLAEAAKFLVNDYKNDRELTVFSVLDAENFYETK